jgi:hypothetical protein
MHMINQHALLNQSSRFDPQDCLSPCILQPPSSTAG